MDNIANYPSNGMDSLTLGQLKSAIASAPRPKEPYYEFRYEDCEDIFHELDDFYSYVERPQILENMKSWRGSFPEVWIKAPFSRRKEHVDILIEGLEHRSADVRFINARRLLYLLQGIFAETSSSEEQLFWIIENSKVVRAANGFNSIYEALKIACTKHDVLCSLSDSRLESLFITVEQKTELIEELTTELSMYLAMLYTMLEVFRSDGNFSEELMSSSPPFPVFLFNRVAAIRDTFHQNYPIKKWLLVLWKALLVTWGGSRELCRVKVLARELADLPNFSQDEVVIIKSSPSDIHAFRQETSVKYPTFAYSEGNKDAMAAFTSSIPTTFKSISPMKLAEAYSPIPVRHHYYNREDSDNQATDNVIYHQNNTQQANPSYIPAQQPLTPAPTPPPSPKPKKQQYQTDQGRPFLFPFSRARMEYGTSSRIPFAIDEADKLYNKHMFVSLAVWQMWKIREECLASESGLEHLTVSSSAQDLSETGRSVSGSPGFSDTIGSGNLGSDQSDIGPLSSDLSALESKIFEVESEISKMRTLGEEKIIRSVNERKEDLLRLKRVEQIYTSILPTLHSWALALTKLQFTMVTICSNNQPPPSATTGVFTSASNSEQPLMQAPLAEEDIDVIRHRELILKAISAILLTTLKWFKVSHVMKFHHLGQLLMDCNGLLINLKLLVFSEGLIPINSRAEAADKGFFRYCQDNFALRPDRLVGKKKSDHVGPSLTENSIANENSDVITDFSWRNMFSAINIIKIIHKLSKHRSHRIWMLVHHKCSVVIKKFLKINNALLQLQVLKLLKSQVPYSGRKWRQSNMKIITQIYLRCRPDLRDEWLTGGEVDDLPDAVVQEQTLRKLVKFYINKRYGPAAAHASAQSHRRSSSMSLPTEGLHPGPELSAILRPVGTPNTVDADVFPPLRSQVPDPSVFTPYTTEDIAFEEEYEEFMSDLAYSDGMASEDPSVGVNNDWQRFSQMGADFSDAITDSESMASIDSLEGRLDGSNVDSERDSVDENLNNWEHMSPKTMAALPKSPAGAHRRSSSGSSLRPVLPFGLDDSSAVDIELIDNDDDDDEEIELGPMPKEQTGPFAAGAGVDEVEYAYGV